MSARQSPAPARSTTSGQPTTVPSAALRPPTDSPAPGGPTPVDPTEPLVCHDERVSSVVERPRVPAGRVLGRIATGVVLMTGLLIIGTSFRVWQVARDDDRRPVDVAVVLGAAQYDGKPSSVFAARLAHAQRLYEAGVARTIVTVGGRRIGDNFTEAESGRKWLTGTNSRDKAAVPADRVVAVETGEDTLGSLRAVADEADRRGWRTAVVVSDPWHSLRARTMARDAGLDSWTSPTRRGPIVQTRLTQARYILRETAALLYYRVAHDSAVGADEGVG